MKKLLQSLFVLVLFSITTMAQDRTITGTVKSSEDGIPLPGVSVRVQEQPSIGVQTSSDGKFSIRVPSNGKSLVFSYLGYVVKTVAIQSNTVNVSLDPDAQSLSEVVVTAGGLTATKAQIGTATTTIKAEALVQAKPTSVASALSGKVAGLQLNAVSTGVNPSYRLVLRGNRSILGNNEALVVVDNIIVPNSILGNLNPDDIEDIQVLNGGGAAALYGSEASNGALIITTKKGKNGITSFKVGQTVNAETISFYPGLQNTFGAGSESDIQIFNPIENQQYGPRFDGSTKEFGHPLEDGSIQTTIYSPNDSKKKFWETGITSMTDFGMSSGDDKSTYYLSAQYVDTKGTTPKDKFNRFSMRLNGSREFSKVLSMNFNVNYIQNRYDITTATSAMYDQILQTPANVMLTDYKDWENNKFANPNGYYNGYYANPYFTLSNSRQAVRNDYLSGNVDLRAKATNWLSFLYRINITTQNASNKTWTNSFKMSSYTKGLGLSSLKNNDINGSVSDGSSFNTQLSTELQAQISHDITPDLKLNATLGTSLRDNKSKSSGVSAIGLTFNGLFNVAHRTAANTTGSESNFNTRQQAVYGDARLSYKDYLYLHATARNDWFSTLPEENNSVLYPSVDMSFIANRGIAALKDVKWLDVLKIRAGYSVVGNVNLGAYSLNTTFGQAAGYPYNNVPGYAIGSRIINPSLKPEKTKGFEGGIDLELLDRRITISTTLYKTSTVNQIVPVNISSSSGYSSYLTNTGEMSNKGIENTFNFVAYRNADWRVSFGGNYTFNDNKLVSISDDVKSISLSTGGNAQVYAEVGYSYPMLKGTGYERDDSGRIIVNNRTGYPSPTSANIFLGNSSPKHIFGVDVAVKYKGLRLAANAEYRGGFVAYASMGGFDFSGSGLRTVTFDREKFVYPNSSYLDPATNQYVANTNLTVRDGGAGFWASSGYNRDIAENYTFNGAYWKIREISLSYDLPAKVLGASKFIKGVNLSVQGRNLFLFTPKENIFTDPDYMLGNNAIGISTLSYTPPTRFFGGSISVTF